jgi:SNF2 family DNA or RNA helicase
VPPPIDLFGYDWPGLFKPYTAQRVTANMLVLNPVCYVLNEMRTGKTMASLWAADFLMKQYPGLKFLIISNLSTLKDVWRQAVISAFLGRRTCAVLHAHSAAARLKRMEADVDFYIGNHDILSMGVTFEINARGHKQMRIGGLAKRLIERSDIGGVIIDEASSFKDATTNRSKSGREIIAKNKFFRWPMTGSPTAQKPTDIHGLRRLVEPDYIDRFDNVQKLLMERVTQFKWKPKEQILVRRPDGTTEIVTAIEMAARLLRPAVRFRAADCFDAPEQTIVRRRAQLSDSQRALLRKLKSDAMALLQKADGDVSQISIANAGVMRSKSLQILSGAVYDDTGVALKVDASSRLRVLDEVLEETDDKVIILAPFTSVLHILFKHLGKDQTVFIDGSVTANERSDRLNDFLLNSRKRFLVAQPEILKFGLDLSAASVIAWFGPVDKTETWIQANRRICGPNQKKPTLVVCISSHNLEDAVYDRLQTQESMQDVFLKLIEDRDVHDQ